MTIPFFLFALAPAFRSPSWQRHLDVEQRRELAQRLYCFGQRCADD